MLIVDSQVHVWAAETPERPWSLDLGKPQRPVPYGPGDLLSDMDEAGVQAAVLVPPLWEGRRNDLAIAAAKAHPRRFAVMARLDPAAEGSRKTLRELPGQPGVLGLRFAFQTKKLMPLLTEGHAEWIWGEAQKLGLHIYVLVPHSLVPLIDGVAQRYPGLKIVMDHCALPSGKKDEEAFRDFDELLAIAKRPNVAVKVSALPCYSTDTYPYRSLHGYVRRVYDAFGPRRMFWGTDLSRSPISYRDNITMFTEEMHWLTGDDLEWIMGRGVCEWLGWML
ncbi:MAG: amidohydrolase family protein [Rhodospirillaceae bacterium]